MRIRPAVDSDAAAIAAVHVRSWQRAYPGMIPQDYLDALDPVLRTPTWRETLAATDWPKTGTLVVVADGAEGAGAGTARPEEAGGNGKPAGRERILGFVSLSPSRDDDHDPGTVGEIQALYLAPEAWGRGAGRRLLAAGVEQLRRGGFRAATLWALRENRRARRFYEREGWVEDHTTKRHDWGSFVATDVRYGRDLAPGPD